MLSILLRRAMTEGYISDCKFRGRDGEGLNISHLFADDTVVFYEASKDQLMHFSWVVFGLKAYLV